MNVFSLGLDEIGTKLQAQGIPVTVANFVSWASLAEEAAAEYKSGRVRTIILVGHSAGATVLPEMLARVSQLGAAVKLAIGLVLLFGPSWRPSRSLINFYIASGSANPSPGPRISVAHCRMSMCRACPGWGTCPSIRTRPMSSVRLMPWCSVTGNQRRTILRHKRERRRVPSMRPSAAIDPARVEVNLGGCEHSG
jgi:hypothetical protein